MQLMELNIADRERITDCLLKIQSVEKSLTYVTQGIIPERDAVQECLELTDRHLRLALGYSRSGKQSES
jgi:hypothetical protein